MSCSSCGKSGNYQQQRQIIQTQQIDTNCSYTYDQITIWKNYLKCVKDNNLYDSVGVTEYIINSYLGITLSALNSGQICFFSSYFDSMVSLIQAISQQTLCQ